ncbi:hypothetical protein DICPUDRAFT_147945 [Dictyostelium purpureum]|uniref:Rhodanese domain-containing protein n=1 Tax=Dictyostelium purpureum TaxID=5786 RepID=F0Z9U4_DICPU|nr:uncharacterized protein DICPUDRAFT_147945 [Dictyostelium purpureum]EGC39274.1 hypothetical protein DICPUDRAFT_147945 [Dictyostelium purpureum]|eukprot:XP_003284178.1 hypothetical protein DICPUDRAFT_147945 [Dictyostelium purpureum]
MFLVKTIKNSNRLILNTNNVGVLNNVNKSYSTVAATEEKKKTVKPRHNIERRPIELQRTFPALEVNEDFAPYKITRDQLKQTIENKENVIIIDLRSPKEFYADSPIKESVNIPMEYPKIVKVQSSQSHSSKRGKKSKVVESKKAYDADADLNFWQKTTKMTPVQWREKFGFPKVSKNDSIIFYSANNGRGTQVVDMAIKDGFVNARFLHGGIREFNKYNNNN